MLHFYVDGLTLGQLLAYLSGILFLAAAARRRASRRIPVSIPVETKDKKK
jgi:hypothetical protein